MSIIRRCESSTRVVGRAIRATPALNAYENRPIQVLSVLIARVTLERRRDHLIALALLRRGIRNEAQAAGHRTREFEIMSTDDVLVSLRWILLVEDHAPSAKLTRHILEAEGYAVVVAETSPMRSVSLRSRHRMRSSSI